MNSKEFVLQLSAKGYNATEIYEIIVREMQDEALSYSTITKYIRSQSFVPNIQPRTSIIIRPDFSKDQKIFKSLSENPDFSVREISADTGLSPSTVHFILTTRIKYQSKLLEKVPHDLTNEQKLKRVQCSQELLMHLEVVKKSGYRYYSTGDESFFFWDTKKKRIWLPSDQKPPKAPTAKFCATKTMITIFWSPYGIQVLKALEPGQSFKSFYFKEQIIDELLKNKYAANSKSHKKKFYIQFDNASPHKSSTVLQFCSQNNLYILPHPPYSPDEKKLEGVKFNSVDEQN